MQRSCELKALSSEATFRTYRDGKDNAKYTARMPAIPNKLPNRRVIMATNAAEIAGTLNRCWLCVDTCMVNQMMCDTSLRAKVQQTVPCSQTASRQRGGWALDRWGYPEVRGIPCPTNPMHAARRWVS